MNKVLGLEYQMSERMFQEILKGRKGEDKKLRPNDYIIKVINETFGLKGTVVNLLVVG